LSCVVEKPSDVLSIERSGEYKGYYHVLHGLWAPLRGFGPEDIKFAELIERVNKGSIKEMILALSSTIEGEATAMFIAQHLGAPTVKITRLAQGMPKGGELEYADDLTLAKALSGRVEVN
jgi:recombination protein RecR